MASITTLSVDCRGVPANVEVLGAGAAVLLIGTAISMAWTRPLATEIVDRGFSVVNFDYQAPSEWSRDPEPRSSLEQSEDAATVLASAGFGTAHVIGISRGAITAFGIATRHPDLVETATLVCPVSGFAEILPEPEAPVVDATQDPLVAMLRRGFTDGYLETHLDHAKALVTMPAGTVTRVARADETPFEPGESTDAPVLVLEFGADQMVRSVNSNRYLQALPHAEHVVIDGAGHGWFHEQPGAVANAFAGFVRA